MALPYKPPSRAQRITLALAAALVLHAIVLAYAAKEAVFHIPPQGKRTTISMVQWKPGQGAASKLNKSSAASSANLNHPATPKSDEEKKKEEEEKLEAVKLNGQLVSLGPPKDERAPTEPTKYLSEYDSRVVRETRARETSAFFKNALSKVQKEGKQERVEQLPRPSEATPVEQPQGTAAKAGKEGGGKVEQAPVQTTPSRTRQDRVALETAADGTVRNRAASDAMRGSAQKLAMAQRPKSDAQVEGRGQGAPGGAQGSPDGKAAPLKLALDHPLESLGPIAGGPMPDHLPEVNEGDETLLNSRSFRYAGYLNRLKEAVGRIWTADVHAAQQVRDPTGQTYLYKDRQTDVSYTLGKAGEILEVRVAKSSGVEFLDTVAVEAFKKAERIPNPPPGLFGGSGQVTMGFSFIIESDHGGPHVVMGPAYLPGSPASRGY